MTSVTPTLKIVFQIGIIIILYLYSDTSILDECELDEKTLEVLIENIKRRLTPQAVKIRAGNE